MLTSTSTISLFSFAVALLQTVSGQQDPLGTCMSLAVYQNPDNADAPLLGSCSVLPQDMPDCLTLTCTNTDSAQQIASFVVNFLPCGENGRKQAVRFTIRDFSNNTLLNRVFFDSESNIAIGQGMRLSVTVRHLSLGITFGVSYSIGGGDTFRLLNNQNIPLDSTEYACPITNPPVTNTLFTTRQPDTSNIRLVGNTSPSVGRLEVFVDRRWGTVCYSSSFTIAEADVACKQLQGFGQSRRYGFYTPSFINDSSALQDLPIAMGNVDCSSYSRRLQDCSFTRNPSTCMHSDDVMIECSSCSLYLCADGQCVNAVTCNGKRDCNDGSDEDDSIACSVLSLGIKIAIGIGVTILVLAIVIPISICVSVCMCTGACVARTSSPGPQSPEVVTTSYNPAPKTLKPVVYY